MKSLTFSYWYEIKFNLYRILLKNCSERQLFSKLTLLRNRKKLLQMPKVAKKLPSTIGKGLKEGEGGGGEGQSSPTEYKGGMWKY